MGGAGDKNIGILWRDLTERYHLEDLIVDWRIILAWIFKK
jgi:hypothetical protein